MSKLDLNERKQRLLMTLVERHIRDGQPVGSKTLATGSGLQVSPATIRNIMAELEDLGILASPHVCGFPAGIQCDGAAGSQGSEA